jgi:hypothetical protein
MKTIWWSGGAASSTAVAPPPPFSAPAAEQICRILGDAVTGSQIPNLIWPLKAPESPLDQRFSTPAEFEECRRLLNERLLLSGFEVADDGSLHRARAAATLSEALDMLTLASMLHRRLDDAAGLRV